MKKLVSSLSLALLLSTSTINTAHASQLDGASDWATGLLETAISNNIVPESLQNNYTEATTRAEFCQLAVATYEAVTGQEITERQTFTDTSDESVEKMAALGVVAGTGGTSFTPDRSLNREEAALILSNLLESLSIDLTESPVSFADADDISSWASTAVGKVSEAQVMSGVGNNRFAPKDSYVREQSMVTMLRVFEATKYEDSELNETDEAPESEADPEPEEEPGPVFYSGFSDVPDLASISNDTLALNQDNVKIYTGKTSSTALSSYVKLLESHDFTQSDKYTKWFEDSQLASTFTTILVYSNNSGRNIYLCELKDTKLATKMTFISIDEEILKPTVSSFVSSLVAEVSSYEDPNCVYKSDPNNYKYGNTDSIHGNPIYVRKSTVDSTADLQRFLGHKYDVLYSPMEEFDIEIEVWDNSSSSGGQNFTIHVNVACVTLDNDIISILNFKSKYGYSTSEKEETLEMIKVMFREIATDVEDCFPNSAVSGSLFTSNHRYPNLKVGYWYHQDLTWTSSNGKFTWLPELDTFDFY